MDVKRKILIVDDEPINLDFFDVMLSKLGFTVIKAEDGEEALEKVREETPDLIILDNIMPKLSGWEVTRLLKSKEEFQKYRDIPIIMFSAMDDVKDKIEGFGLGVEDYITKPFNFSEVLARIKAVLRNRELSKRLVQKERHLALISSLNKSLIYFTDHLKDPMTKLLNGAKELREEKNELKKDQVKEFAALVVKESEEALAALKGLEEEVKDLNTTHEEEQKEDILEDLEEKFQKHFLSLKDRQESLDGVS